MKISIVGVAISLASISIVFSLILCNEWYNTGIKIDLTNELLKTTIRIMDSDTAHYAKKDSLERAIYALKFEKATYVELMDSHSNLVIGYVTLLFAIFAITGITISNKLAGDIKNDYTHEKSKYDGQIRLFKRQQNVILPISWTKRFNC